jgi:hypothetical protein
MMISLKPLTVSTWKARVKLKPLETQKNFPPGNLYSIAEAQFYPRHARESSILMVFWLVTPFKLASALLAKMPPVKTSRVNVVRVSAKLGLLSVYVRDDATFQQLLSSVQAVSYAGDKLAVVARAAQETDGFTAQQVAALLG